MYNSVEVQDFYDQYGEKEWRRLDSSAYSRLIYDLHCDFMKDDVGLNKQVLDAGCGSGRFSIPILESGSAITLLDISAKQIEIAKEKISEKGFNNSVERYLVADISNISDVEDSYFDTVICYVAALNYLLDNLEKGIYELKRVTKNHGNILVSVNSRWGVIRMCLGSQGIDFFGKPDYWMIWEVIKNGKLKHVKVKHPERHFFESKELKDIFESCGLKVIEMASGPALSNGLNEKLELLEKDATAWETIKELEKIAYKKYELSDAGEFLMAKCEVIK